MAKKVTVYSSAHCPYCEQAKALLDKMGIAYEVIRVDEDPKQFEEMQAKSNGLRTVPQIFIGDHHVGGFDALRAAEQAGELNSLLEN